MDKTKILVLTKTSWRRPEDVFWRSMINKNIFVFIKTSSRRLHQDECLLGNNWNNKNDIYNKSNINNTITTTTTIIIKITIIIKCRGRYRTPTATNTELLVTLHNGRRPLSNIKKSPASDAARALYMPLKRLIYHLTWWIGVDHAA